MRTQNLSMRNRIILYVISAMVVLSMIISAIVSFTPNVQTVQPTSTVSLFRATPTR